MTRETLRNAFLAAVLVTGGSGVVASCENTQNFQPTEKPGIQTPVLSTPDTSWQSLLPSQSLDINSIDNIPLAEITREQGVVNMVPINYPTTKEYPYGYSLSLQQTTLVAIEEDKENNSLWIALKMPGDAITQTDENLKATNFDGSTTELYGYKGFTAWVEVLNSSVIVGSNNIGQSGISHFTELINQGDIKIGDSINLVSISFNQPQVYKEYQQMNLNSLQALANAQGQKDNPMSKEFKFKADTIFVSSIVK